MFLMHTFWVKRGMLVLVLISPAKNMKRASLPGLALREPLFRKQTEQLAKRLRQYQPWELEGMLKINPQLALKAYADFQEFDWESVNKIAALMAYDGLVFQHIGSSGFTLGDYHYADAHIRILSAFYGLLAPSHGIQPYRLEMAAKFRLDGQNLYQFWGERCYQALFASGEPVLNLASVEYSKLVTPFLTDEDRMTTVDFLTMHRGKLRIIATAAKMARGEMVRYIVRNRLKRPEEVQGFVWKGYTFIQSLSDDGRYVFVQRQRLDGEQFY